MAAEAVRTRALIRAADSAERCRRLFLTAIIFPLDRGGLSLVFRRRRRTVCDRLAEINTGLTEMSCRLGRKSWPVRHEPEQAGGRPMAGPTIAAMRHAPAPR